MRTPSVQEGQQATGAAGTVALDGTVYVVTPLTPAQEFTLFQELRRQALAEIRTPLQAVAAIAKDLPPQVLQLAVEAAVAQQPSGSEPTKEAVAQRVNTPAGTAFHLWLLTRAAHPDLPVDHFAGLVTEDNLTAVQAQLWRALGHDREKKAP